MKARSMLLLTVLVLVALAACTAPPPTPAPTAVPPTAVPPTKAAEATKPAAPQTAAPQTAAPTAAPATAIPATSAPAAASPTTAGAAATKPPAPTATLRPPAVTAAPGAIKINFWHHLTAPEQVEMMQRFADDFNAKNPQYYVIVTAQGSYSDIGKKVNAAITAGALPDLATGNPGDLLDWNTAGVMNPLDSLLKDPKDGLSADQLADMSFKLPNGQELFFDIGPDGKTYGISPGRSAQLMVYNADMLKAAGFNNAPATWDEFDKVCAAVTKGDNYCLAGNAPSVSTSPFAEWVFSRGGTYSTADEKKATFDDAAGVDALKWLKNLVDKGWAKNPSTTTRGDQTDLGNGKLAFMFTSTAGLPFIQDIVSARKEGPFQWDVAPVPAGPKGKPVVTFAGPSIGMFKTTPERQRGAWLFLKYMFQPEKQVEFSLRLSYYAPSKSARDQIAKMTDDQVKAINPRLVSVMPQFKKGMTLIPNGMREPINPAFQGVRNIIDNMVTAVYTGKSTADFTATDPDAAAKEGVQRVNKALDQYGK